MHKIRLLTKREAYKKFGIVGNEGRKADFSEVLGKIGGFCFRKIENTQDFDKGGRGGRQYVQIRDYFYKARPPVSIQSVEKPRHALTN